MVVVTIAGIFIRGRGAAVAALPARDDPDLAAVGGACGTKNAWNLMSR